MRYQIQWIKFRERQVPIILQYVNGPCPLIAVMNVLFLRQTLHLRPGTMEIDFTELCAIMRGYLQHRAQEIVLQDAAGDEARCANTLQNLEDALKLLPKLESGLDINVRFTDPLAYEFTNDLAIFDLAGVRLVHGWCVEPQDAATNAVVGNKTYNELVDFLTLDYVPNENDSDEVKSEKMVQHLRDKSTAQAFLNDTRSQLTISGLEALHQVLKDEELAVLFRNNHFSCILKHNTRLYNLVSDSGLIGSAPYIVWSYVNDVSGDQLFLDHDFKIPHPLTVEHYAKQPPRPLIVQDLAQHHVPVAAPVPAPVPVPSPAASPAAVAQPQAVTVSPQPSAPPADSNPDASLAPAIAAMSLVPPGGASAATASSPAAVAAVSPSAGGVSPSAGTPAPPAPVPSPAASPAASVHTPSSAVPRVDLQSVEVRRQQEQFARENGLRWNEATQNYEPLPQPQAQAQQLQQSQHLHPHPQPYQQPQAQHGRYPRPQPQLNQPYQQQPSGMAYPRQQLVPVHHEEKKKKDSCAVQ